MHPDQPRQPDLVRMEGRLAIFTEKWIVALVRVHSIRVMDRDIRARVQSIPTQGLYGKYEIGIGTLHEYLHIGNEVWIGRAIADGRSSSLPR